MKKGKFIPVGEYNNVKIGYGTVDYKNLKTIYIQLSSWTQPTDEDYDYDRLLQKNRKSIKSLFFNLKNEYFKPECIVDLDIKTGGIKVNKRSFMDLEITLFVNKTFDVRSNEIKEIVFNSSKTIIDTILVDDTLFNFFPTKN
jgi:hypothetical protein